MKNHVPIEHGHDVPEEEQVGTQKDEERDTGVDKRGYAVGERAIDG